jgi:hypothetical protein
MNSKKKTRLLVYILITIAAMAALAGAMEGFNLQRGMPILEIGVFEQGPGIADFVLPGGELFFYLMQGLLALGLILSPFVIIHLMRTPQGRRRLIIYVTIIVVGLLAIEYLHSIREEREEVVMEEGEALPFVYNPDSFVEKVAPPDITAGVAIAIAVLLAVGVTIGLWLLLRPQRPQYGEDSHLEALAKEAQLAVDSLIAGGDLKNTIIQCYARMSSLLQEERYIRREDAMTPREFIGHLEGKGIPSRPVRQLTRLFEQVRYGRQEVGANDEQLALLSLTEIVQFCRGSGSAG